MAEAAARTGHPKGLYLLCSTEMWERVSYYGMRALLVLYLADSARGGLGWSDAKAMQVYALYTGLVYLTPLLGGWLADNVLGQHRAVVLGGLLMMVGHFVLAVPGVAAFWVAVAFLCAGNGLFKPNIAAMVGGLYGQGDARRDSAFTYFYMGVNLGALVAPLVCGTLGERVGWHWGFGAAGVGMGLGVVLYLLLARRLLGDVGRLPSRRVAAAAAGPAAGLTKEEKDRILVIPLLALFNIFFWTGFEQGGGLMNLFTERQVDRVFLGWEIPATWFQSVNSAFILLLAPLFAAVWTALGRRNRNPSSAFKMGLGIMLLGTGFIAMMAAAQQAAAGGKASFLWIVLAYFLHTAGELCVSPVGLSMVNKLAPARLMSLLMATWYLSNAASNYLAGQVGAFSTRFGEFQVFAGLALTPILAGAVLLVLSPRIKRMMHGAEEPQPAAQPPQQQTVGTLGAA